MMAAAPGLFSTEGGAGRTLPAIIVLADVFRSAPPRNKSPLPTNNFTHQIDGATRRIRPDQEPQHTKASNCADAHNDESS
jgi:hypothetical protein